MSHTKLARISSADDIFGSNSFLFDMYIPFIFLALCHVACAVRTQLRSDQKLCPKANLVKKPRVFALES